MKKIMLPALNTEFLSKSTTKKGAIAELLVTQWLIARGTVPYIPHPLAGAHPIDMAVMAKFGDTAFCFSDVKCKALRTNYPDTGIDERHYGKYTWISKYEKKEVYLFFVDEDRAEIYGGYLSDLDQPRVIEHNHRLLQYPIRDKGRTGYIIYFPYVAMEHIASISPEDVAKLKAHGTSEFAYKKNQQAVIDLEDLAVQP